MGVPRRAVRQIVLGVVPFVLISVAVLVLLTGRLDETLVPLRAATAEAEAEVTGTGLGGDARELTVQYVDGNGDTQTARLVLDEARDVELGLTIPVAYDPDRPGQVYVEGDAVTSARNDLLNGLFVVGLLLLVVVVTTVVRIVRRRRLTGREAHQVRVHREKYRRGVADRSWLVVHSADTRSWVPVYWDDALAPIGASPVLTTVQGDPDRDQLVGFVVDGVPVWPSGRRRRQEPKGREREVEPTEEGASLGRQIRTDVLGVFAAPLFGMLWAYVDGSGPAGFVFATVVAAGFLFWLPSAYGSDPT